MTRHKGKCKVPWYSATEQAPTETGYYMVCHDNTVPTHRRYSIALWLQSEHAWTRTHSIDSILYWTYLPDLPEGFAEEW